MLESYAPLVILIGVVLAIAVGMLGLSHLLSTYRFNPVKLAPYESGVPVLGSARERFSVKFYLVAMLFIIFDIETVFMMPWATAVHQLPALGPLLIGEMVVFVGILGIGYLYIWKRGALQWD